MNAGLLAGLIAMIVAAALTPLVRRVARAVGAVDAPGGRRIHLDATPRLGGVAIVAAFLAAVLTCIATGLFHRIVIDWRALWFFLAGGLVIALGGAVDDVRSLGARRKLLLQVAVATLAWIGHARVASTLSVPGFGPVEIGATLSYVFTIIWIVAFINAINLIDGLDGLAGGVIFFASVTNIVVAVVTGNGLAIALNAALGGATLGFLVYNFNPATIFMGDTGSMFLGYALGTAALMSSRQKESTLVSLLVPVIALGLPFADTLLAMIRRVAARRSVFSADRGHLHHRLLDLGLTQRRAVLVLYGTTLLLCIAAVAAALGQSWQVGVALIGALTTLVGITRFAGSFGAAVLQEQQRDHLHDVATEALRRALPELIVSAQAADSPSGVWAALERLLTSGAFASADYAPGHEEPVWRWQRHRQRDESARSEVLFPIRPFPGTRNGTLRFVCLSEHDSPVSPHTEVLLQLAADAVEAALVRLHLRTPATMMRAVAAKKTS